VAITRKGERLEVVGGRGHPVQLSHAPV
jgi:hypothetical protein